MEIRERLRQALTHKQRHEIDLRLKQSQILSISQILRNLAGGGETDSENSKLIAALDQTFIAMEQVLAPDQVVAMRKALKEMFFGGAEFFIEGLLRYSSSVIFDGPVGVRNLTAELCAKNLKMASIDGINDISEGAIRSLLIDPARVAKHKIELQTIIEGLGRGTATDGAIKELSEANRLLQLYENYRDTFEQIVEFIQLILGFPSDVANPLRRALVDIYMIDQAGYIVSERLLKRFAATFSRRRRDITFNNLNVGVANIIGEYLLVGMGVIDPEIFKLMSGKVNYDVDEEISIRQDEKQKIGILMKKYDLNNGKFFYNRYATLMVKPGLKTDEIIRDFLTRDVRAVRTALCSTVGLQSLIDRYLHDLNELDFEEAGQNLMDNITTSLSSPESVKGLADIIKNNLLPRLIQVATQSLPGQKSKDLGMSHRI